MAKNLLRHPLRTRNECEAISGLSLARRGRLPATSAVAFGAGSVATTSFVVAPQLLLLFYMTERLGIPAGWAGVALIIPKLWEFFFDPWLGWRSDRTTSRWGRRRPILLLGALLFPPAFALLFAVPDLASWPTRLIFVIAVYTLATTAYSLFAVPFVTLPGELAEEPHERTRLVAFRMSFVAIGVLAAGAMTPTLIGHWGSDRAAYALAGGMLGIISAVVMIGTFFASRTARVEPGVRGAGFWSSLGSVRRARHFRSLAWAYVVQMAAVGANSAMLAYVAKYVLGRTEGYVGLFFGVLTLASLIAMPAFVLLGRRVGKRSALRLAVSLYAVALLLLLPAVAVGSGESRLLLAIAGVVGVANAGAQLFAFALLPDVLEQERARTGAATEGLLTGVWIAGEKLGLAAGAAAAGFAIEVAGFVQDAGGQSPRVIIAIVTMFSVVPAGLMLASLSLLGRRLDHHLVGARHDSR